MRTKRAATKRRRRRMQRSRTTRMTVYCRTMLSKKLGQSAVATMRVIKTWTRTKPEATPFLCTE